VQTVDGSQVVHEERTMARRAIGSWSLLYRGKSIARFLQKLSDRADGDCCSDFNAIDVWTSSLSRADPLEKAKAEWDDIGLPMALLAST